MASSALTPLVRGERGVTMIEVTMMLLATVTLIGAVAPVDSDPWGNRFAVNVQYLGPSLNDVVVLSAGINEIIETDFTGNPLVVGGDDVLVVVEP